MGSSARRCCCQATALDLLPKLDSPAGSCQVLAQAKLGVGIVANPASIPACSDVWNLPLTLVYCNRVLWTCLYFAF